MSLSALNYPPLVASAGAALSIGLPSISRVVQAAPWSTIKIITFSSYAINLLAVSRPGRLDGEAAQNSEGELSPRNGRTLVAPAGWAFAIWGPIFLGELLHVTSQLFIPASSPLVPLLTQIAAPFTVAQLLQSLWCAAFRPKYKNSLMYISSAMLAATAYSLNKAHSIFTNFPTTTSTGDYLLHLLPIALHFGWVTAASLVNLNGAISMLPSSTKETIAAAGHLSVVGAAALGTTVTLKRSAPVYGAVISWALLAVADSMKLRLGISVENDDEDKKKKRTNKKNDDQVEDILPGLYGAKTQLILSRIGALVCSCASAFVAVAAGSLQSNTVKSTPAP